MEIEFLVEVKKIAHITLYEYSEVGQTALSVSGSVKYSCLQ